MAFRATHGIHLIIPGLLDRVSAWQADFGDIGRFPHLEWLLARAVVRQAPRAEAETLLAGLFGLDDSVPFAALRRLGLTRDMDPGPWICMDPVHLEPGVRDLVLTGPAALRLTGEEAEALTERVNRHLAAEGLRIEATGPGAWHMRLPDSSPLPVTHGLGAVLGRTVNDFLPAGPDATLWHQRLNEIQMVLFDAPENQAREARGLPSVNSVWPWGAGRLPAGVTPPAARIFGQDPLLSGLARCAGLEARAVPESPELLMADGNSCLVFLDDLMEDVTADNLEGWQATLEGLEQVWFGPLRRGLASGISEIRIRSGGVEFSISAAARRRFWRRPRPLGDYAS